MHLTTAQIAAIEERLSEVEGDTGYGSVELIVERGRLLTIRTSTSQRFLDEMIERRMA